MSSRRRGLRVAGLAACWVAAVSTVAAVSWLAVDSAGAEVSSTLVRPSLAAEVTGVPEPPDDQTPTTAPSTPVVPPTTPAASPTGTARPTGPPPSTPAGVSGFAAAKGGIVRVTCYGSRIDLLVTVNDGWWAKLLERDAVHVDVGFYGPQRSADYVQARCVHGTPVFSHDWPEHQHHGTPSPSPTGDPTSQPSPSRTGGGGGGD